MRKVYYLLIISLLTLCSIVSQAQYPSKIPWDLPRLLSVSNIGTEYWFTIPPAFQSSYDSGDIVQIFVTSEVSTKVVVELSNRLLKGNTIPHELISFDLTPDQAQIYTKSGFSSEVADLIAKRQAVRVSSEAPILVYVLVNYQYVTEGFLALPVSALGREYIVSSYGDASANFPSFKSLPSLTGIVIPYDNTTVSFTLLGSVDNATAGGIKPGETVEQHLNRGDVWMISSGGKEGDLSGSTIIADKPVAVISGNQCANIPINNNFCDYIAEMEMPVQSWGTVYPVASIKGRKYSSILRIFAKEPNTSIYRNDSLIFFAEEREFYETRVTEDELPGCAVFSADKPVGITLYNTGREEDGQPEPISDPFQMALVPIEQFQKEFDFALPKLSGKIPEPKDHLTIIYECEPDGLPSEDMEYARIVDGPSNWKKVRYSNKLEKGGFLPVEVGGRKYAYAILNDLHGGVYKIKAEKPFVAYVYGFSNYGSFGYPASASIANLESSDTQPPNPTWIVDCKGPVYGWVEDMPQTEERSNLAKFTIPLDGLKNYKFNNGAIEPGVSAKTWWQLSIQNPREDASARLIFTDQAGNDTTIEISYSAIKLSIEPKEYSFGLVKKNTYPTKEFVLKNLSETATAYITEIKLKNGDRGFELTEAISPFTLDPLGERTFEVRFDSDRDNGIYADSIGVGDTCLFYYDACVEAEIGGPVIDVSDIRFGDVTIGENRSIKFYIKNSGLADLLISGIDGPQDETVFSLVLPPELNNVSSSAPYSLEPGEESIAINVIFTPQAEVEYIDQILIKSDASVIDSIAFLSGRGIKPGLAANSLNFGNRRINRSEFPAGPYVYNNDPGGLKLENKGSARIDIDGYQIVSSTNGEAFIIDSSSIAGLSLEPGESRVFDVIFMPEEPGPYDLTIKYLSESGIETVSILQGTGVVPKIEAENVDFGVSVIDDENRRIPGSIVIRNPGVGEWQYGDTLNLFGIETDPPDAVSFDWQAFGSEGFKINKAAYDFESVIVLLPGESIILDAEFFAQKTGPALASLNTISDALEDLSIRLTGEGIAEGILVKGDSVQICRGATDTLNCLIQNYGSTDVEIKSLTLDPPDRDFELDPTLEDSFILVPGESKDILVQFDPTAEGEKVIDLVVETNTATQPEVRTKIEGNGYVRRRFLSVNPAARKNVRIGSIAENSISLDRGESLIPAAIKELDIEIRYNNDLLEMLRGDVKVGSLVAGKFFIDNLSINQSEGSCSMQLKSIAGDILQGDGELLTFAFNTYFPVDSTFESDIDAIIVSPGNECVEFKTRAAKLIVQPVCQSDYRRIVFSEDYYELSNIVPNPVGNDGAEINFSVGLDGHTRIEIYNNAGIKAAVIVDEDLQSGDYSKPLPVENLTSGTYIIKMLSGPFHSTRRLIIMK